MNADEARAVVAGVLAQIAPEIDFATVLGGADLQEELELDSMDFLNLVTGIAEQTGVEISERDYPAVVTVDGLVAYLTQHAEPASVRERDPSGPGGGL